MSSILEVKGLTVSVTGQNKSFSILDNLSFSLEKGKWLGLLGPSGAGKSTLGYVLSNTLLDKTFQTSGQMSFGGGADILSLTPKDRRRETLKTVGIIFQNAMSSLDPYETVGHQLLELIHFNEKLDKKQGWQKMIHSLSLVGLEGDQGCIHKYPGQLSGGMRQRVLLAMSLIQAPPLLVADEPTASLDGIHKLEFLSLLKKISKKMGLSVLYISHDLSLVAEFCDDLLLLDKGKIVSKGSCQRLLTQPDHPLLVEMIENTVKLIGDYHANS